VRDAHPTTCGHVEANQFATLIDNSDEADVIGKDINVVNWWNCNSNFELKTVIKYLSRKTITRQTFRGK
jgi:hypothetical protein